MRAVLINQINQKNSKEPEFMAPPLQIYVGTTWIKFRCSRSGLMGNRINVAPFIQRNLQNREWVPYLKRYSVISNFVMYDTDNQMAIFPRYSLDKLLKYLGSTRVELVEVAPITPRTVKMEMKNNFELRKDQKPLVEFITDPLKTFKPVSASTGSGKLLRNSTLIKVPGGWKPIGEMKVGDLVMTPDGTYCPVTGVYPQGRQQLYRVTFKDGRYLDAGAEHLWWVIAPKYLMKKKTPDNSLLPDWTGRDGKPYQLKGYVLSTLELIERMQDRILARHTWIPYAHREQIADRDDLLIDPYLLGVLLGDGCITRSTPRIMTDKWILDHVRPLLPEGMTYTDGHEPSIFIESYSIVSQEKGRPNKLSRLLKQYGLYGKHAWEKEIPECYMNASSAQRLALLQGLMDTDGSATNPALNPGRNRAFNSKSGSIEYSSTSRKLALQVQYLVRSLGGYCSMSERIEWSFYKGERKKVRTSYRLLIRFKHPKELFRLPRKQAWVGDNMYTPGFKLRVEHIEPLPEKDECTCIAVDHPSHCYVAENFVVTHNTVMTIDGLVELNQPALLILGELVGQWYKSFRQFTKLSGKELVVIQGKEALTDLWLAMNKGYRPKIVILSLRTAMSYIEHKDEYAKLPTFAKFQEVCGFGFKCFDEVHMQFNAKTKVDLCCNIKNNIYLSATYLRTNLAEKRIFDMVFPHELRYSAGKLVKYTVVHMLEYSLGIGPVEAAGFTLAKGYNHATYEKYLIYNRKFFDAFMSDVLIPVVRMYFLQEKKKGQKLLILAQTRDMTIEITKALQSEFKKEVKIEYFFSMSGRHGREDIFRKFDIIVSTHKSCGTGRDIKNMKTCINTVSFSSPVLANQVMGRLRQLPGEETIYVDLWNKDIGTHAYHQEQRMEVYRTKALRCEEHQI